MWGLCEFKWRIYITLLIFKKCYKQGYKENNLTVFCPEKLQLQNWQKENAETVHLIVLIFSLLLDREFLQGGIHVQLVGLQLPEERLSLYSQTHAHNLEISAGWNNYMLTRMMVKK